jgi:peptide deformylase
VSDGERSGPKNAAQEGWSDELEDWKPELLGVDGRVRAVVAAPHLVLSAVGAEVDPTDPEIVRLAADLVATMRVSPGCVGLAAPQIGVAAQVFCVDVTAHPKAGITHGTFVLCNAKIIEASRWRPGREGCMSVPDLTGDVKRAGRIAVEAVLPGTGEPVRLVTDAFEARALQHEIDHCAGKLFLDRVAGAHAIYQRKVYL